MPILDHTDGAQYIQEIEFLLLWATTESNMADILNLEKNSQNDVWPTGNEFACCQGQQRVSNMADKHEIEDNALRAHLGRK